MLDGDDIRIWLLVFAGFVILGVALASWFRGWAGANGAGAALAALGILLAGYLGYGLQVIDDGAAQLIPGSWLAIAAFAVVGAALGMLWLVGMALGLGLRRLVKTT